MSKKPETVLNDHRVVTSEISVQVEMNSMQDYFSRPSLRFSSVCSGKKLELDPSIFISPSKVKQKILPIVLSSSRRKSLHFNSSISEECLEKKHNLWGLGKNSQESYCFNMKKRSNSNEMKTPQQIRSRLKLIVNKVSESEEKRLKDVQSRRKLEKNQSSYQIPPVFDPISNFSKGLQRVKDVCQPKPMKLYRKYAFGAFQKVQPSSSEAHPNLKKLSEIKQKYFLKRKVKLNSIALYTVAT